MVSKEMRKTGSLVQDLDAKDYGKIAGILTAKKYEEETDIEIERKRIDDRAVVGLWSREPEKAKKIIKEVLEFRRVSPITKAKELLIDVFDKKDYLVVVAELPPVNKKDIKLSLENVLKVSVDTKNQKYYKEVSLSAPVKIVDTSYNNNVLEIKLKKVQD
ncbi:MAG: hypothetical protein KJ886_00165 [Candidatus Thermoplasmatota archaeon]|nr:hypothetical protein [Candidatus Thermoplasmatota archaeon]MCG2826009.1 hypothetical protein [Thermoplasmatales archaeon]